MSDTNQTKQDTINTDAPISPTVYDMMEYTSNPFENTHPEHLYTIGRLFGMRPQDFTKAKVLELGCASGGNIYPMAYNFPKSHFVGIDLSIKQINHGLEIIKELGLKNIKLKHMSIMDIDHSFGKFDYIICHGTFSWVPEAVREKILTICKDNLNENGIAYISYNTLPGWNMVGSIRDMMLFHSSSFSDPIEKTAQARSMLNFICEGLTNEDTPYAKFLKEEVNQLSTRGDHYIYHEHLADVNVGLYFKDFMALAGKAGLSYLSDVNVPSMFSQNMNEKTKKQLGEIKDIVMLEQYMDFIRNRRFRASLLCHNTQVLNRNIDANKIENFYLRAHLVLEAPLKEEQLEQGVNLSFLFNNLTLKCTDKIVKLALLCLTDSGNKAISYGELCKTVLLKCTDTNLEAIQAHLRTHLNLAQLFLTGIITIHSTMHNYTQEVPKMPKVSDIVRFQATKSKTLTNQRHECVMVSDFQQRMIGYLDGKHSQQSLTSKMLQHVLEGGYTVLDDRGQAIEDKALIEENVQFNVKDSLEQFAKTALLVE